MRAGKADVRFAIWIWHNDPNRTRGKAAALCYIANGGQKVAVISMAPLFILWGLMCWWGPVNFLDSCVIGALLSAGIAFIGTSIIGLSGLLLAATNRFRLWIDEEPDIQFATEFWPPVRSEKNLAPLFSVYPLFPILLFGAMAVPEKWIYHAAAGLLIFVPLILWVGHVACARTIEDCYEGNPVDVERLR